MQKLITSYEPLNILNEVNKLFENSYRWPTSDTSNIATSQWAPAVDISEEKDRFVIIADLPGLDKKDINIAMENNILTIQGKRDIEIQNEDNKSNFYRIERVRGNFYRQFTLPDIADGSKIQAKIHKGVLEIILPKKETAKPRFIEIESED